MSRGESVDQDGGWLKIDAHIGNKRRVGLANVHVVVKIQLTFRFLETSVVSTIVIVDDEPLPAKEEGDLFHHATHQGSVANVLDLGRVAAYQPLQKTSLGLQLHQLWRAAVAFGPCHVLGVVEMSQVDGGHD